MLELSKKSVTIEGKTGTFVRVKGDRCEVVSEIGRFRGEKVSAAYRKNACWMGIDNGGAVPEETQFLLLKEGECYTAVFALCDGAARTSLYSEGDALYARTETYDENVAVGDARAVFTADGKDPYLLISSSFEAIRRELKSFELKYGKPAPRFFDRFGFCTYNAMSDHVTEENLLRMAQLFRAQKIPLGYVIIDDGWHSHDGNYLLSFDEDRTKFPDGLEKVVSELKGEYGVGEVLCWHSYNGYWQGIKGDGFPGITAREEFFTVPRRFALEKREGEEMNTAGQPFYPDNIFYEPCGFIQNDFYEFYSAYYENLKKKGVDGTKVDAVAWAEAFSQGRGGRGKIMQSLVSGLESASTEVFAGELINCSACSNDFFYNVHGIGATRVSTDYIPNDPASYFHHLYSSAYVGMWTDPILFGDWDMFQSGADCGEMHAKARSISGGPVYCSDGFETISEPVIRPLVSENGFVGKCLKNAMPTEDCLFLGAGERLLKVFNYTMTGYVVGLFNCSDRAERAMVDLGKDIEGLPCGRYIVYSDERGLLGEFDERGRLAVELGAFRSEILTVAPVTDGAAVVGLKGKYNPSGFVSTLSRGPRGIVAEVIDDGEFLVWKRGEGIVEAKSINGKIEIHRGGNYEEGRDRFIRPVPVFYDVLRQKQ